MRKSGSTEKMDAKISLNLSFTALSFRGFAFLIVLCSYVKDFLFLIPSEKQQNLLLFIIYYMYHHHQSPCPKLSYILCTFALQFSSTIFLPPNWCHLGHYPQKKTVFLFPHRFCRHLQLKQFCPLSFLSVCSPFGTHSPGCSLPFHTLILPLPIDWL